MQQVLWVIGGIWAVSGVATVIIFVIDERAHRHSLSLAPDVPSNVAAAAQTPAKP